MSILSNVLIDLKASEDFVRLSIVLYALACLALCFSHQNFILSVVVIGVSCYMIKKIIRYPKPYPHVCALLYTGQVWMIILTEGEYTVYQRIHICIDAGFFTLLKLSTTSSQRYMVIFHDQLSHEALKMLYVIGHIKK